MKVKCNKSGVLLDCMHCSHSKPHNPNQSCMLGQTAVCGLDVNGKLNALNEIKRILNSVTNKYEYND